YHQREARLESSVAQDAHNPLSNLDYYNYYYPATEVSKAEVIVARAERGVRRNERARSSVGGVIELKMKMKMRLNCLHSHYFNIPALPFNNLPPSSSWVYARTIFPVPRITALRPLKTNAGLSFSNNLRPTNIFLFAAAASQDDHSKPTEEEVETEKDDVDQDGKASQEAWEQVLASFKDQALKLKSVSQEAYDEYSKKAVVVLKETAETLKIQADQARQDLVVMAQELGEDSRQYLTVAAVNFPEPVKDVVDTFASAEHLNDVSKVCDFYVGIPYGTILSAGGFLSFMLTGSISALRFGVILGGIMLALSVSSLQSWKNGQSTEMTLKGQAAIAGILFLRDIGLLFQGLKLFGLLKTVLRDVNGAGLGGSRPTPAPLGADAVVRLQLSLLIGSSMAVLRADQVLMVRKTS
ncbi:hypothetical protein KSS87_006262, partial [Heliosperma pusillum]